MHSSKTRRAALQMDEKEILKCSVGMALSERPLTIGCCQQPKTVSPHLEMRDSASNPMIHPPSMTEEINYEGQGASPRRPKPRRLSSAWSGGSPLKPDQNCMYLLPERGQRKLSGHSSENSGGLSVIDKEDLLDTIFIDSDTDGCGRVPVSRVIQHIHMIVGSNESNDIDELALQLDPSGLDIEIDLAAYQNGIARWVKTVQNQRHLEMIAIMEDRLISSPGGDVTPHWKAKSLDLDGIGAMSTPLSSTTRSHWKTRKSDTSRLLSGLLDASLDLSSCSYGSLEAQGGDSPPDMSELQNQIEDLQFQIRKLSEHNGKLQTQVETSDDTNDQLMCQIESLRGELKSLQQVWQRSQSIRDENEELKSTNKEWLKKYTLIQREKRCLDDKLVSLQLEASKKQELESKLQEIQEKLSINIADAEALQEDHRRLQTALQKKKHQCEETEAHLEVKNAELSEKAKRCEEMQANLEELYNLNRVMKAEKTKLEGRLSEVCQELDSYRTQQLITPPEVNSMSPSSPRSESGLGRSLHSELKSVVSADENLPSPICGNEDFDFESHIDSGSSSANTPDTPSSWQQPSSANQLLVHFRRRKDDVMRQLQRFLVEEDQNSDNGDEGSSSKAAFTKLLETELDSMMDKMATLAKSRKHFEHRANKLSFMLQSLQDDYVRISKKYEEAIKHCKELTSTKCELERVKTESDMLQFSIQKGKHRTMELERNLSSCQLDLESAHQAQQSYRKMVETQLGELRRLFKEMEKKYKIAQDNARKQEAAYKSKTAQQESKHCSHVKSILDLVKSSCGVDQKTLGTEEGQEGPSVYGQPLNNTQVLETVSAYLTELKNQLAQVKGQLISLKVKKFSQEHRRLCSCRPTTNEKSSAVFSQSREDVSVLLDALLLDVVDEDFQRCSSPLLFQHRLPWQRHVSKDDTLISTLRSSPAIAFNDLIKDFKRKALSKVETVSTQTEICRTPDRQVKPYSRSSQAQTSPTGLQSRNTDTQTERESNHHDRDEFKSASFRLADSADVKQAYLVSKHPTLNSAILLPVDESVSPGDSASDLSDSFVTAFSSPINCSPLRSSLRESPDWDTSVDFLLGSNRDTTSGSLTLPKESTEIQESSSKNAVTYSDIKIPSVHRKTSETHQEEIQQRMEDMLGTTYARPNIVVEGCQADMADSEDEDHNANYDRSGKYSPSTPRKLSPARLKRRSLVEKRTSSLGSENKMVDLISSSNLVDVEMTEEENELSLKLLEESKKASDRTKNRRGRRWSPVNSPDQHLQRPSTRDRSPSPTLSTAVLANVDETVTDNANAEDQTSPAQPENHTESPTVVTEPTTDTVTEGTTETCPTGELQEERTGGEGESDKEDNKLPSTSERKDSEVEEFDIKADILKATGPIQGEMPQVVKPVLPLAKLREEHKLQRKSNMLFTMPDLTEATESEPNRDSTTLSTTTSSNPTPLTGLTDPEERLKLVEDSTTDDNKEGAQHKEGSSTDKSLLPDSVLKKLGLKVGHSKETCALTENEIEEKFNALQLAFKANQYTLQNRVMLHHRQRDLAEKNIDGEIEGLLQSLQMLEPLSSIDTVSRDYISKIKQHVEVLQSSSLRLSSKAEGFGAVQQEGRLSKATEVMISHVENLKRLFEREHAELEDAKKLLQENRKMFRGNSITSNMSADGETDSRLLNRRALSVSGGSGKKPTSLFQLAKLLTNPNKNASVLQSSKGKPVLTTQIHQYSLRMRSASMSSSIHHPPKNPHDSKTGRRRASVATVVGAGLLSSSYGSPQSVSFGGQHTRSQTEPAGVSMTLTQPSRLAGAVRRTSVQLSSSLNTEDFKEAKARLTGSLSTGGSNGRHSPLMRTDSSVVIKRRSSDDGQPVHPLLDGMASAPLLSPSSPSTSPSRRHAVSLQSTPMVLSSSFPKVVDAEASPKDLTKVDGAELNSEKKEEVFQKGFEQGLRTQVSQEFSDLREQQKVFCDSLEDLMDQAEEQEKEETNIKQSGLMSSNKILQHLQKIKSRWPRAVHTGRLILTAFVFLLAVTYVILTVIPTEACLGGSSVMYSPWRTLKELLWPYTELRHSNPPPR